MNIKMSIIVPIYNARKTLVRCLDSILAQSFTEYEIILVEDGSTDESGDICEQYARREPRIRFFRQPHMGVSESRNNGLRRARGAYLLFIDSDDWMEPDMCAVLAEALAAGESQMAVCNYNEIYENRCIPGKRRSSGLVTQEGYMEMLLEAPKDFYFGVVWNKLYLREMIQENQLAFPSQLSHGEDFTFNMRYLACVSRISICNQCLYHYSKEGSSSLDRVKKSSPVRVDNRTAMFQEYRRFFRKKQCYEAYKRKIDSYMLEFAASEYFQVLFREKEMKFITRCRCLGYIQSQCLGRFGISPLGAYGLVMKQLVYRAVDRQKKGGNTDGEESSYL